MANLWTFCHTALFGKLVGKDSFGNRYYQGRRKLPAGRRRRWVVYKGAADPTCVPAEWHGWLHYTSDDIPPADGGPRHAWQQPHRANPTGTAAAYRPPGHLLAGGRRDRATGDYESWTPE